MMPVKLQKGQAAWIHNGGAGNNPLVKGRVIELLKLDGYALEHYVIEIPTSIEPILLIRSVYEVSESPDKPIGFWRRGPNPLYTNLKDVTEKS